MEQMGKENYEQQYQIFMKGNIIHGHTSISVFTEI